VIYLILFDLLDSLEPAASRASQPSINREDNVFRI